MAATKRIPIDPRGTTMISKSVFLYLLALIRRGWTHRAIVFALAVGGVCFLGARASGQAESKKGKSRLEGQWPETSPSVDLDLEEATIGEALEELAEAAHWDLVFAGANDQIDAGELTLRLADKPATEALEVLLELGDLNARLVKGVLIVSPAGTRRGKKPGVEIEIDPGASGPRVLMHTDADDRINAGGEVRVEAGETVKDAVAMGGDLYVAGHVRGDAVAIGGDVHLESGAVVDGETTAIGGEIIAAEDAVVHGDRVSIGDGIGGLVHPLVHMAHNGPPGFGSGFFGSLVRTMTLLILGLLLLAFVPRRIERVRSFMLDRPGHALLGGLGLLVGFVPLCVLLVITVIGIPLIPVVVLVLLILLVMGLTAMATWLGEKIPVLRGRKTPLSALVIGLMALMVIDLIPIIGTPVVVLLGLTSAGAVLLSRFGRLPLPPSAPDLDFP